MKHKRIYPLGDEAGLFRQHNRSLVRVLQSSLNVPNEVAEDAAQVAWAQFYRYQPNRLNVVGWLYTTARHEVYAAARRSKHEPVLEEVIERAIAHSFDDQVEAKAILEQMVKLKPQQQQALMLLAEGYSYAEIVEITGKTRTWVNRHLTEGRDALRKLVE